MKPTLLNFIFIAGVVSVAAGLGTGLVAEDKKEKKAAAESKSGQGEGDRSPASAHGLAEPSQFGKEPAPISLAERGNESALSDDGCIVDRTAIEDLRKRREEVEAKAGEIARREAEFAARERALEEQLKKLEEARKDLLAVKALNSKESEEKVAKLVETFETMSPKAASQLIATLDEALAVTAMARMSTPKLAKIMNLMEPERSGRLTELLAGVALARGIASASKAKGASPAKGAAEATKSRKGGE